MQQSLEHADQVLDAIALHREFWRRRLECASVKLECAIGDSLMSCAIICYQDSIPDFRKSMLMSQWKALFASRPGCIPLSDNYSLVEALSPIFAKLEWFKYTAAQGVSDFETAVKVKVVADFSQRCWPLLFDSEGSAVDSVRTIESKS